uniref:Toxin CptA n=1 Tax=Arsenophonus endosymbiont of Trialeurodes vaporariorum TaxID=235567 RepID=A0A3B0M0S3_9GAMM
MVLWKFNINVSWLTQLFSTGVNVGIGLLVFFSPWPPNNLVTWLIATLLIVASWVRSQKNISRCKGSLALLNGNKIQWKKSEWLIVKKPWFCLFGIKLTLRSLQCNKRIRLWIASDSMPERGVAQFKSIVVAVP